MIRIAIVMILLFLTLHAKTAEEFEKNNQEELRLMLQSFLYINDLEDAYKTAKIGYSQDKNSIYWNQKLAEISMYRGDANEAIKYMKFIYSKTEDKKVAKQIIDYGLSSYQYEDIMRVAVLEAQKEPTKENIDRMVYIYSQVGLPQEAAEILYQEYQKNSSQKSFLTEALKIYMEMGDLISAKKIVDIIEKDKLYSRKNIELLAYFYYLKMDINSAYEVLFLSQDKKHDIKYYQLLSDLGWYLQKYKPSAKASEYLIQEDKGRLVDYERVIDVYKDTDSELALKRSLQAYEKFKLSYLFYLFANHSIKHKKFDILKELIQKVDKSTSSLKSEANYWLIKAQVYKETDEIYLAKDALNKARELEPDSLNIQLSVIFFYSDYKFYEQLKLELDRLSDRSDLPSVFYYPLASLYFSLDEVDKAAYYIDKVSISDEKSDEFIDFKFLQADIYRAKNNEYAFMQKIYEIEDILKARVKKDKTLKKDDKFLNNYLRAKVYISSADEFEDELYDAKPYLTKAHYDDLSYFWAMRTDANERAYHIYQRVEDKPLWLKFSNALAQQNHTNIENLLTRYIDTLPSSDATQGLYTDGEIAHAQTKNYEILDKNFDSQDAYIQHLELSKQRSNLFDIKFSNYNRDPLLRRYVNIKNSIYIGDGYYALGDLNYYKNSTLDDSELIDNFDDTLEFKVGLKRVFKRGYLEFKGGYCDAMESYGVYSLDGGYKINHYFNIESSISKNIEADETTQLLLGGKKDMLSFDFRWDILASTSLDLEYENNSYESQDDVDLGDGDVFRISLSHQLRNGYPDMRVGVFYYKSIYNETSGSRGVIDDIQEQENKVLPNNFYNLGMNFSYGMANSDYYTRVWRPYFEVNSYYNSESSGFDYGMSAGYGGKAFKQDHMVFGVSYAESTNGIDDRTFELFLRYKFGYAYP
jgi:hypothetical protein